MYEPLVKQPEPAPPPDQDPNSAPPLAAQSEPTQNSPSAAPVKRIVQGNRDNPELTRQAYELLALLKRDRSTANCKRCVAFATQHPEHSMADNVFLAAIYILHEINYNDMVIQSCEKFEKLFRDRETFENMLQMKARAMAASRP